MTLPSTPLAVDQVEERSRPAIGDRDEVDRTIRIERARVHFGFDEYDYSPGALAAVTIVWSYDPDGSDVGEWGPDAPYRWGDRITVAADGLATPTKQYRAHPQMGRTGESEPDWPAAAGVFAAPLFDGDFVWVDAFTVGEWEAEPENPEPTAWSPSMRMRRGPVTPSTPDGFVYVPRSVHAPTAMSGSSEPDWDDGAGDFASAVDDGGLVWSAVSALHLPGGISLLASSDVPDGQRISFVSAPAVHPATVHDGMSVDHPGGALLSLHGNHDEPHTVVFDAARREWSVVDA